MQRATYLAHLYESVSSIPPDIQQCLLTIAQFGCEPDQVKRWYTIVRHHFGVGEPDSPVSALPHESMPPPRQRPQDTPTRSGSSTSSQISPASYQGAMIPCSTESMVMTDALGIQQGLPQQMISNPWMTPAVSESGFDIGSGALSAGQHSSAPAMGGFFGLSPSFETGGNMPSFTGSGLVQVPDSEVADFSAGALAPRPVPYEFTMSSAAMPVFVKLEPEASPTVQRGNAPNSANASPSRTSRTSAPSEPAHKRSRTSLRQTQNVPRVNEPMPRPRRPSVPFRANSHATQYTEPAQIAQTPSRGSQPSSFVHPVDLTRPSPSVSDVGTTMQPAQAQQLFQSPEQTTFNTPWQQQQPHRQDSRQGLMQTPEQQHYHQMSRQHSQQQFPQTSSSRPPPPSPYSQQHTSEQSHHLFAQSEPPPYKSPYA